MEGYQAAGVARTAKQRAGRLSDESLGTAQPARYGSPASSSPVSLALSASDCDSAGLFSSRIAT